LYCDSCNIPLPGFVDPKEKATIRTSPVSLQESPIIIHPEKYFRRFPRVLNPNNTKHLNTINDAGLTISKDKKILFQSFDGCLRLFPVSNIRSVVVQGTLPAKGSGGSDLYIELDERFNKRNVLSVTLCSAGGPDELNEVGTSLARYLGCALKIEPYLYDA
jgi:hypothetical protein